MAGPCDAGEGAPEAANRAFSRGRAIINKAIAWGYQPQDTNPCTGVKLNRMCKVERFLSPKEFQCLEETLERHRMDRPLPCLALSLLTLTGCRMCEITALRWRVVWGSRIHLADSKTGARTVQLCRDATWMLGTLTRRAPDDHVFDVGNGKPISVVKFWQKGHRGPGLVDVPLHDLRHRYAGHAARLSLALPASHSCWGTARWTAPPATRTSTTRICSRPLTGSASLSMPPVREK